MENSSDVSEELRLVQDFNEDKPRVSKVILMNKPLENYIIYEEETVEYLNIGSNKSVQVYYREDIFIEEGIGGEVTELKLQNDVPRFETFDLEPDISDLIEKMDDDNSNLTYEYTFLTLGSINPVRENRSIKEIKKSTMTKCYKWYRKRFTYPICAQSCKVRYPTKRKGKYTRKFTEDQRVNELGYSSVRVNSTEVTKDSTFIFDRCKKKAYMSS